MQTRSWTKQARRLQPGPWRRSPSRYEWMSLAWPEVEKHMFLCNYVYLHVRMYFLLYRIHQTFGGDPAVMSLTRLPRRTARLLLTRACGALLLWALQRRAPHAARPPTAIYLPIVTSRCPSKNAQGPAGHVLWRYIMYVMANQGQSIVPPTRSFSGSALQIPVPLGSALSEKNSKKLLSWCPP